MGTRLQIPGLALAFAGAILAGEAHGRERPAGDDPALRIPFRAGENLSYALKVGGIGAGSARMRVIGVETVRGTPAFHTSFEINGKLLFKKVENRYESWFDTADMSSLRHIQRVSDGENKDYEFFPDRRVYVRNGEERPSVAKPLDEGSFVYYLRALPLEVGRTYTIARYYNAERNPVVVRVVRRERIKVPAGEFDAIMLRPTIRSRGLFGEDAQAEVWVADNPSRTILKLRSKMTVGTLQLELK